MYLNDTSFQTYPLGESLCANCSVRNDMAVIHRFHTYVPGWGIPPKSSRLLTTEYGLITDCLVEAYHYIVKRINLYATIKGGDLLEQETRGTAQDGGDQDGGGVLKTPASGGGAVTCRTRRVPDVRHRRTAAVERAAEQAEEG